ncbi:MAG TPA: hypothetical protein VE175_04840, partial [Woeseiaceae bacterium]|nr:hypothetical protein [Woeseiaceae bacterium]
NDLAVSRSGMLFDHWPRIAGRKVTALQTQSRNANWICSLLGHLAQPKSFWHVRFHNKRAYGNVPPSLLESPSSGCTDGWQPICETKFIGLRDVRIPLFNRRDETSGSHHWDDPISK